MEKFSEHSVTPPIIPSFFSVTKMYCPEGQRLIASIDDGTDSSFLALGGTVTTSEYEVEESEYICNWDGTATAEHNLERCECKKF